MPLFIRMASSVAIFKSKLKTYLFDKAFILVEVLCFMFLLRAMMILLHVKMYFCFIFLCTAVFSYSIVKHMVNSGCSNSAI